MKNLNDNELLFLKSKTRQLISLCGGVEAASSVTRVSKSQLGNYQNPSMLDSFMPIDIAIELERDINQPIVTGALAQLNGSTLSSITPRPLSGSLSSCLSRLGKEFGDVFAKAAHMMGTSSFITDTERQNLLQEIEEALGACVAIKAAVSEYGKTDKE